MSNYPFRGARPFARNQWYIAAWADEVTDVALARTILGEELVLFRMEDGAPAATSGFCPHRWAPLEGARATDGALACPYHGARFDGAGRCLVAPLGQAAPARFALRSYPLVEQGPCLWIWPGDPARAEPGLIPDARSLGLGAPGWWVGLTAPIRLAARAQLLIENLFDQSHVGSVHPTTLAGAVVSHGEGPLDMDDTAARLSLFRTLPATPADDGVRAVFPEAGDYITARLATELLGVSLINSTGSRTFSADADGTPAHLVGEMNFLHGVTPETATSTHYFTAVARNFATDSDAVSQALMARNARVVAEDIAVLEAIERRIDAVGDARAEVTFASDAGAMHARRRMARILDQDAG